MSNSRWLFIILGVVAAVVVVVKLRGIDWRPERAIQISYRTLPAPAPGAVEPVVFLFDRQRQFTAISVFRESEIRTNKYALAVWELVSDTASAPLTHLHYGAAIPGMKPRYAGVGAEPLAPDTAYRIVLRAGKLKGERTFTLHPVTAGR
jgi:hypothetical protein